MALMLDHKSLMGARIASLLRLAKYLKLDVPIGCPKKRLVGLILDEVAPVRARMY